MMPKIVVLFTIININYSLLVSSNYSLVSHYLNILLIIFFKFISLKILLISVSLVPIVALVTSKILFNNARIIKLICFNGAIFNLFLTLLLGIKIEAVYYYNTKAFICTGNFFLDSFSYSFQIDGFSIIFLILIALIIPICCLVSWSIKSEQILLQFLLSILQFLLTFLFATNDLFWFYFFYECTILPILLLIINWGSNIRRQKACILFGIYSVVSSILLFLAILIILYNFGTTSYSTLLNFALTPIDLESKKNQVVLTNHSLLSYLSLLLFFSFAVKIPSLPFLAWLPEAHVEAPTVGSMVLAALLLKIGGYGLLRWFFIFNTSNILLQTIIIPLLCLSAVLGSFYIIVQIDFKRIIAYSSIVHINLFTLSLVITHYEICKGRKNFEGFILLINSYEMCGLNAAVFGYFSHGIISAGLFALIGILYTRFGSRLVIYYEGLATVMPIFSIFFFIFILSNNGFPLTSGFYAELILFISLISGGKFFVISVTIVSLFLTIYASLLIIQKLLFGALNQNTFFINYYDLTEIEYAALVYLIIINIWIGFVPNYLLQLITLTVYYEKNIFSEPQTYPGPTTDLRVTNAYYSSDRFIRTHLDLPLLDHNPNYVVIDFIVNNKLGPGQENGEDLIIKYAKAVRQYYEPAELTQSAIQEDEVRIAQNLKTKY